MSSTSHRGTETWRTVAGTLFALGGFAVYVWAVGTRDVVEAVRGVSPRHAASLVVLGLVPVVVWGTGLWVVLRRVEAPVGPWDATVLFAATEFVNAVTPFGQSGGTPVSSLLVAWEADVAYERAFAAVVSFTVFVRLASVTLGLLAAVAYSSRLVAAERVRGMVTLVAVATLSLLVVGGVLWAARRDVEPVVGRMLGRPVAWVGRRVPGVTAPTPESVADRVERFVDALDLLAADPWRLLVVFGLATFGELSVAAVLWTALDALGVTQPLPAVLLLVPLARVSGLVPTPGALGSAEVVLSGLLVALMGVPAAPATAAALVYRATAYWIPTALGAVATGHVLFSSRGGAPTRRTRRVTAVAFLLAVGVSVGVIAAVHVGAVLAEPTDAVVHLVRDVGLGVLGFALLWALFTTATR